MLVVIHKNSSSIEKYKELYPLDELKAKDARPAQAQVSLNMFIPNYLPSRQGKSLDFELAMFLIRPRKIMGKNSLILATYKIQEFI